MWKASEISAVFTGRIDWGLFASVFPCLWGDVADRMLLADDRARALAGVQSEGFLRVVQDFRRTNGIAPHPAVAYKIWEEEQAAEETPPTPRYRKRAGVTPRTSTPRSRKRAVGRASQTKKRKRIADV